MAGPPTEEIQIKMGMVYDWRSYFTPEQSAQLDEKISQRTAGSGLDFT